MRPPGSNPEGAAFVFAGANPPTPSFSAYFVLSVIQRQPYHTHKSFSKTPTFHNFFHNIKQFMDNSVLPLKFAAFLLKLSKGLIMFCPLSLFLLLFTHYSQSQTLPNGFQQLESHEKDIMHRTFAEGQQWPLDCRLRIFFSSVRIYVSTYLLTYQLTYMVMQV